MGGHDKGGEGVREVVVEYEQEDCGILKGGIVPYPRGGDMELSLEILEECGFDSVVRGDEKFEIVGEVCVLEIEVVIPFSRDGIPPVKVLIDGGSLEVEEVGDV